MGCCLVAAVIISVLRRARYAVLPGRPPVPSSFAPAARRPGPGEVHPSDTAVAAVAPRRLVSAPVACALTLLTYVAVVAGLDRTGLMVDGTAPLVGWTARDLGAAALLVVLAAVAARTDPSQRSRTDDLAATGIAVGATWTALAIVDMHVLALFELGAVADVAFHGAGLAVLMTGLALLPTPLRLSGARPRTTEGVTR